MHDLVRVATAKGTEASRGWMPFDNLVDLAPSVEVGWWGLSELPIWRGPAASTVGGMIVLQIGWHLSIEWQRDIAEATALDRTFLHLFACEVMDHLFSTANLRLQGIGVSRERAILENSASLLELLLTVLVDLHSMQLLACSVDMTDRPVSSRQEARSTRLSPCHQ